MLRFFLDANVLFALAYSDRGASSRLFALAKEGGVVLLTSEYAIQEARERLFAKYPERLHFLTMVQNQKVLQIIDILEEDFDEALSFVADPDDAPIIAAARKAKVDALVSFDRKHIHTRAAEKFINAPVITAGDALEMLRRAD